MSQWYITSEKTEKKKVKDPDPRKRVEQCEGHAPNTIDVGSFRIIPL